MRYVEIDHERTAIVLESERERRLLKTIMNSSESMWKEKPKENALVREVEDLSWKIYAELDDHDTVDIPIVDDDDR